MATLKIEPLDEKSTIRLQIRALKHGRTVEEEARAMLTAALDDAEKEPRSLVGRLRHKLRKLGSAPLPPPVGKSPSLARVTAKAAAPAAPPAKKPRSPAKKVRGGSK